MPYNVLAGMAESGMLKSPVQSFMEGRQQQLQNALANRQQALQENELAYNRSRLDAAAAEQQRQAAAVSVKERKANLGAMLDNLESIAQDPQRYGYVYQQLASHPGVQQEAQKDGFDITELADPRNITAVRAKIGLAPPAPKSNDPGELVQIIGPNGQPTLVPRAQAVNQRPYIKPDKPDNAPSAPSGYRWGAGGALEPIPGGPADPSGPAARRTVAPLRKEFDSLQSVKDLKTVLPLVDSATRAPDTGYGDLQLIYTVGKVLDPGSVVREGELQLALQAGSPLQRLLGTSSFVVGKSGRLTPELRSQIKAMLAERVASYKSAYDQDRSIYEKYASDYNVDPTQVVGKHPMEAYKPQETRKEAPPAALEYLKAHPDQAENFRKKYGYLPGG